MQNANERADRGVALTLWTGQILHWCSLAALLGMIWGAWQWAGEPSPALFWTAVGVPVVHQMFVWICWRTVLVALRPVPSYVFPLYLVGFFALFFGRFVSLAALAWVDAGSLNLPMALRVSVAGLLAVPGLYAGYSVVRYFGLARAAGADHFFEHYQSMPLVQQGIFRYTSNGMYVYAFLLFWAIAVGGNSLAAMIVAGFSHAYIWVHYCATEKPDMDYLYADSGDPA